MKWLVVVAGLVIVCAWITAENLLDSSNQNGDIRAEADRPLFARISSVDAGTSGDIYEARRSFSSFLDFERRENQDLEEPRMSFRVIGGFKSLLTMAGDRVCAAILIHEGRVSGSCFTIETISEGKAWIYTPSPRQKTGVLFGVVSDPIRQVLVRGNGKAIVGMNRFVIKAPTEDTALYGLTGRGIRAFEEQVKLSEFPASAAVAEGRGD